MKIYSFSEYIVDNFPVLICVIGLFLILIFNRGAEQVAKKYLIISNIDVLLLTIIEYLNIWALQEEDRKIVLTVTLILSFVMQSVPTLMMVLCLRGKSRRHWPFLIPLAFNLVFVSTALFSPVVFSYDEYGNYYRGSLWFVPYVVSVIYIVMLAYYTFKMVKRSYAMEALIVVFVLFAVVASAAVEMFADKRSFICQALAVGNILYYMYIHVQAVARDHLTGLLNRSSFYQDVKKKGSKIKGIVYVDMNELKWINENFGYEEGDRTVIALGKFLKSRLGRSFPVYRMCGEEFAALVLTDNRKEVEALVSDIRDSLKQNNFNAAVTVAFTEDVKEKRGRIDSLLFLADKGIAREKSFMKHHGLVRHVHEEDEAEEA